MTPSPNGAPSPGDRDEIPGNAYEPASTVSEWVLVPREPTEAMREAAFGPILHGGRHGPITSDRLQQEAAISVYRMMVDAAPSTVSEVERLRAALQEIVRLSNDGGTNRLVTIFAMRDHAALALSTLPVRPQEGGDQGASRTMSGGTPASPVKTDDGAGH